MKISNFCVRFFCILLTNFVFGADPAAPKDVAGWSEVKWGMSEQEIQSIYSSDVTKLPQRVKYDDRYFDLVLSNFRTTNLDFTVRFLMNGKSDRLAGVSLRSADSKLSADMFWALEKELIRSYGPPSQRTSGAKLMTSWNFPSSRIEMLYGESPLAGRFVYLNYTSTVEIVSGKP